MIHKGYRNSHELIQACTQSFKFRSSSWWSGSPTGSTLRSNPEAWLSTVRWVLNISTSRNVQRAVRVRGFGSTRIRRWQACTNVRWSYQSEQTCWYFMLAPFSYYRCPTLLSHTNLTPWVSSFCSYSTAVHAFRSTTCSTDSASCWLAFWSFGQVGALIWIWSTQAYSKVHNTIHSSATVNEYPQQTPQNPQVPASCQGYISIGHWALGIDNWALVIGYWALVIGHR